MRLLILALAALPISAVAETYTASSSPTAVTVYNGFAVVTRDVKVDVVAGAHEIVLPDLPQWVNAGSLRVHVTGAQLGSTRLRTDALPPQPNTDSVAITEAKARIDAAERALRDLADSVEDATLAAQAAEARLAFVTGLTSSETLPTDPQALADLAQMIEAQTLAAKQTQLTAQREARRINEERADLQQDLEDTRAAYAALTPPSEPAALLALTVNASEAGTVTASISYPVRASWEPTYDVVLNRGDTDTLTLRRAALINQNGGENWDEVYLTLSTLAPNAQVAPSELFPPLLRFDDPQKQLELQRSTSSLADVARSGVPEPIMEMAATAQANFDGPGVTYTLATPISIAQSAEGARVELDALEFDARVFARAVPSRDTSAFLMAQAVNASAEPLLAASSAQIFVDGALVGQSSFSAVPAGGDFLSAFGPVEDLRLRHVVLDRSEGDRGLISRSNAQTQEVRLTVENIGADAWNLEVLHEVPYSEQDDLVIQWAAQPPADEIDVEERRGLVQWNVAIEPKASQEIMVEQNIRWPEGKVLRR
ncbi:MAG: DUF4139 domain-containing protein [Sulfitobacter sp.]